MEPIVTILVSVVLSLAMMIYAIIYAADWLGIRKKVSLEQFLQLMEAVQNPVVIVHGPSANGIRVSGVIETLRITTVLPHDFHFPSSWTVIG